MIMPVVVVTWLASSLLGEPAHLNITTLWLGYHLTIVVWATQCAANPILQMASRLKNTGPSALTPSRIQGINVQ